AIKAALQGPFVFVLVITEEERLAVRANLEVLRLGFVPLILDSIDAMVNAIQFKAEWALVHLPGGIAIDVNGDGHDLMLACTRSGHRPMDWRIVLLRSTHSPAQSIAPTAPPVRELLELSGPASQSYPQLSLVAVSGFRPTGGFERRIVCMILPIP